MPTPKPTIPDTAIEAANRADRYRLGRRGAEDVLRAALPHLLPGLYVAPRPGDNQPTIWRGGVPIMTRAAAPEMFAILAALIPDRTEGEDPS